MEEEQRREPTITELLSIIKLFESVLKFYAEKDNYKLENYDQQKSLILNDEGHQARFALKQLKKISEYEVSLENEINKLSNEIKKEEEKMGISGGKDFSPEKLKEMLNEIKLINDTLKNN